MLVTDPHGLWNCPQCVPWISAQTQSHLSSSRKLKTALSVNSHAYTAKFLCFPAKHPPFSGRTNSNLTSHLTFGHSSLSHSFHTMPRSATIFSLWLWENIVQGVSHPMNVHVHFEAQWAGIIPVTEPWLTRSSLDWVFCPPFVAKKKNIRLRFWLDEVQWDSCWQYYACQKDNKVIVNKNITRIQIIHDWQKHC